MMCFSRFLIGTLCLTAGLCISCRTVEKDPATTTTAEYNYVSGDLFAVFHEPYPHVWDGCLKAVEELELTRLDSHKDGLSGQIHCKRYDGKKITIEVKKKSHGVTGVNIQTGALSDKDTAVQIFEKIKEKINRSNVVSEKIAIS